VAFFSKPPLQMPNSQKQTRVILFLIVFTDMMGFSLLFPLFPKTIEHFLLKGNDSVFSLFYHLALWIGGDGNKEFTMVLFGGILGSIYSFLQFLSAPIWGKLSDQMGRRFILIFTTLGSVIGYSIWLFSSQFWMFVLSRVITGIMGGNLSVASAAMADTTDEKSRAAGMGLLGAGIGLGFIMGPLFGGMSSVLTFLDFLYLNGTAVIFPASAFFGIIVSLITLILIVFYLKESKVTEKKFKEIHPLLAISKIESKNLIRISILNLLFVFGFSGFEFVINFYLSENFHFSPKDIGFTFLYIGMIIVLVQGGIVRRLSGKFEERSIAGVGSFSVAIGFLILILGQNIEITFIAIFFLAFGSALVNPGLSSFASLESGAGDQGMSLGFFRSFGSLARALSPVVFAVFYFKQGAGFTFIISLLILVVFWFLLYGTRAKREISN